MDILSEILDSVHLEGAVYLEAEFTEPWCVEANYGQPFLAELLSGSNHFIFFHYLLEGHCQTRLSDGTEVLDLKSGDFILFARDYNHLVGSDLNLPAINIGKMVTESHAGLVQIRHGGGGNATRFICGYLACDPKLCRPLLNSLPSMIRVSVGADSNTVWLEQLLRVGVNESLSQRPGARSLLTKISELLFVEAMRRYVFSLSLVQKGWLAALRDPYVGKALTLLHTRPGYAWTVDELAREVALSRSALAERFTNLIGEPPIQYLTRWRLALSAKSLRSGSEAIKLIAERCGYDSVAAFNRAFKREFGVPPAAWRKQADRGSDSSLGPAP